MMNVYVKEFPKQLRESINIGRSIQLNKHSQPIHNVVILGMGGSGIGGNFAAEFVKDVAKVPVICVKGYTLPAFVDQHSLVIASSYSGNTEETLSLFDQAIACSAKIICLTSGGKLAQYATDRGLDCVIVPNNGLPPRACLGYSLVQQLFIFKFFGLATEKHIQELEKAIVNMENAQDVIMKQASQIAKKMQGKFPIIYATERMESVALRLRQQLNENSKILASHNSYPEMNHNELVGWREQSGAFIVLNFRSKDDHKRNDLRISICNDVCAKHAEVVNIDCIGESLIEQAMYGVHVGDWITVDVGNARQIDLIEVDVIDYLKGKLASASL